MAFNLTVVHAGLPPQDPRALSRLALQLCRVVRAVAEVAPHDMGVARAALGSVYQVGVVLH